MKQDCGKRETLRLTFEEGRGHTVHDSAGKMPDAEVRYRFRQARYIPPRDPSWRTCGPHGSALLFDGNSTWIEYPPEAAVLRGEALTLSAWIAPRAFACADPEAREEGLSGITGVIGQADPEKPRGAMLGYEALGRPCFTAGTGAERRTVRAETARLKSGAWNHVAAVFDGAQGEMRLYVDGREAGRAEIPKGSRIAPAEGHALMIGKNEGGKRISAGMMDMFCGLMGEVCLEETAADPEEIARRAAGPRPAIPWDEIGPEDILAEDPYKTRYHGGPRQHWMNEPHAPLCFRGTYHLFFQSNSIGSYWGNIAWGHLVSPDMVRWRQVKDAITPGEDTVTPDGVWTGGAAMDENGMPVLFFTAADLGYTAHGLISNQNIGAAWPVDPEDPELKEWRVLDQLAIRQEPGMGRTGEFRDSHVWREEDGWYMTVCGGSTRTRGGAALCFRTRHLEVREDGSISMDWKYLGPAFEMEDPKPVYGTSWELPVIMPVTNRAGTKRRYVLFLMPAPPDTADNKVYYYLGDFCRETGRFTPDGGFGAEPGLLDYGDNIFTGASVFRDPETGRVCVCSIMQDQRTPAEECEAGWAHCCGLTRNLRLTEDGTDVCMTPDPRVESLREEKLMDRENLSTAEANAALAGIREDMYCLEAEAEGIGEQPFALTLQADEAGRGTVFRIDPQAGRLTGTSGFPAHWGGRKPAEGPLACPDGRVRMTVYTDRSLTEAFFQEKRALSLRSYAPQEARRIFFEGPEGMRIRRLRVWRMSPI